MRGLPKIVLERLKSKSIGNRQSAIENQQSPHPDANLLAAFVEKTLTARERTQVLNHLAQCAECRELVTLTLPAKVDRTQLEQSPARRGWSAWPTLRWGALAAALGAVVVVVALHSFPWRKHEIATRPPGAESKRPAPLVATAHPPATLEAQNVPPVSGAREISKSGKATSLQAVPTSPLLAKVAPEPSVASGGTPKAGLGAEAQARLTTEAAKAESVAIPKGYTVGGALAPSSTPPAPRAVAPMRVKEAQALPPSMAFRKEAARALVQPTALWTISSGGKVQRSDDGGKTWEEVPIDDTVTFRVIQAVGKDVWAGGSGGALYHSSDGGAAWTRANLISGGSPTTEPIVAITSSSRDLQHITVRTASGEQWSTEDGGQHWQSEPSSR